jgi:hypothetical protein
MTDLVFGRVFHSIWLDLQSVFGRIRPASIESFIEICINIVAGFISCSKGTFETASQNGPENLAISSWL